jgi:hypothetical protein
MQQRKRLIHARDQCLKVSLARFDLAHLLLIRLDAAEVIGVEHALNQLV